MQVADDYSTVSKILRQREKYINLPPSEDAVSPGKKSKAKLPDFEKTLAKWVSNQQRKGVTVSDEDLKKQARIFSFSRGDQALVSSSSWLEKFKQKNKLGKYAETDSTAATQTEASPLGSPASSIDMKLPIATLDEYIAKNEHDQYFDFNGEVQDDDDSPASDEVIVDDDMITDLPAINTFTQLPNSGVRGRSQTLSNLDNYAGNTLPSLTSGEGKPPISRSQTTSLAHQSHVDPVLTVKRHKSVPDIHDTLDDENAVHFTPIHAPPLPHPSESVSPVSNPISPAEDDNIKALHAIKKLLQDNPGVADPDDYLAIGKLMEKMKLLRSPTLSAGHLQHGYEGRGSGRKRGYPRIS